MTTTTKLLAAAAAFALLGIATAANAAPVGALTGAAGTLKADAVPATEQVTYRCWRHRGHVHCGNVRPQVYSYSYAPRPYYFAARPYVSFGWGGYRRWY